MPTLDILANISVIIIAFQLFIILLVPAVLLYLLIRGIGYLQGGIKVYGPQARRLFGQVAQATEEASQKAALPVMVVHTTTARAGRIWSAATALFVRKEV